MKKLFLTIPLLLFILLAGCCKDDDNPAPPSVTILSDDIAAGELLDLNKTVTFSYKATQEITQGAWTLEVPTESGESVIIFTQEMDGLNFTLTTPGNIDAFIPDRDDYLRTGSGMLDARVRLSGTFANGAAASADYAVELPYRPSIPTLEVCGIEDDFENWKSEVTFCFTSRGETTGYLINYRPLIGFSTTSVGVDAHASEKTIPYIHMDMEYYFSIIAYNQYGNTVSDTIIVGSGNPDYYLLTN